MNNELALLESDQRTVQIFIKSGFFADLKSEAQGIVKVMAGRELGMGPFESMRDLNIIQGKIAMAGAQVAARMKKAGGDWTPDPWNDEVCVLKVSRNGKIMKTPISFSIQDARKMGLAGKDNYIKQPKVMLYWRAITQAARVYFPDVFGGAIYTPEELRSGVGELEPLSLELEPSTPALKPQERIQEMAKQEEEHDKLALLEDDPYSYRIEGRPDSKGNLPRNAGIMLSDISPDTLRSALKNPRARNYLTAKDLVNIEAVLAGYAVKQARQTTIDEAPISFEEDDIPEDFRNE